MPAKSNSTLNLKNACDVLGCKYSAYSLQVALLSAFPGIEEGQKKLDDLLIEISKGESELMEVADGHYVRKVNLVTVNIVNNGHILVEAYRILPSGEKVRRNYIGVSEKMVTNELPFSAAERGVYEELEGAELHCLQKQNFVLESSKSTQYNGLTSIYHKHSFLGSLDSMFIKDTYREESKGVETFFVWAEGLTLTKNNILNYTVRPNELVTVEQYQEVKSTMSKTNNPLAHIVTSTNYVFNDGSLYYMDIDYNLTRV